MHSLEKYAKLKCRNHCSEVVERNVQQVLSNLVKHSWRNGWFELEQGRNVVDDGKLVLGHLELLHRCKMGLMLLVEGKFDVPIKRY